MAKLVREHINEKFTNDSDPIKDMGIGKKELIRRWLNKMYITNYQLTKDLEIDVNDEVDLSDKNLTNLPEYIQFNKIKGLFRISRNSLTSLRGCPVYVNGLFDCADNKLTSLEYAPKEIHVTLFCSGNPLKIQEIYKYVFDTKFTTQNIWISNGDLLSNQLFIADFLEKNKRKRKKFINEVFTNDSDPIQDMNIGLIDKLNKKISVLYRYPVFLIYGEKIKITRNGEKFIIIFSTMRFQKWDVYEKEFNDVLIKEGLNDYLIFPPNRKRNIYMSNRYLVYNIKKEYQSFFKKLKKEYVYIGK